MATVSLQWSNPEAEVCGERPLKGGLQEPGAVGWQYGLRVGRMGSKREVLALGRGGMSSCHGSKFNLISSPSPLFCSCIQQRDRWECFFSKLKKRKGSNKLTNLKPKSSLKREGGFSRRTVLLRRISIWGGNFLIFSFPFLVFWGCIAKLSSSWPVQCKFNWELRLVL